MSLTQDLCPNIMGLLIFLNIRFTDNHIYINKTNITLVIVSVMFSESIFYIIVSLCTTKYRLLSERTENYIKQRFACLEAKINIFRKCRIDPRYQKTRFNCLSGRIKSILPNSQRKRFYRTESRRNIEVIYNQNVA